MSENSKSNVISFNGKHIKLPYAIRKTIAYPNITVVQMYDSSVAPDNVIAYNLNGRLLWKLSDIILEEPPQVVLDIDKEEPWTLKAFFSTGTIYKIDVKNQYIIGREYLK